MTIYLKRGTDVGAPSLTGTVGAGITLFDYLLVTTMGWTKEYTGTNVAVYRPASGNRFYLRVDDTNAFYTLLRGYEAMTDVNTGTGLFPTTAQFSSGLYLNKARAAGVDAVNTDWQFISNGKLFYFFHNGGTISSGGVTARRFFAFGDFVSYKSGDAYNTIIISEIDSGNQVNVPRPPLGINGADSGFHNGHYLARTYTQLGTAVQCSKRSDTGGNFSSRLGGGSMTYPAAIEGGLLMAPVWVQEGANSLRGLLPGLWNPLHQRPLTHGDTFSGVGALSGRTFEVIDLQHSSNSSTYGGQCFIETSDTWDTA